MDWTVLATTMTPQLWAVAAAWGAVCSVWGGLLVAQWRAKRDGLMLAPIATDAPAERPPPGSACVVIPARNEAGGLAGCLERVLSQDCQDLSVVVVDDRSEDATFEVARRAAARDPRVRALRLTDLPPGWLGKSHALWCGSRGCRADWLLFIDADCALLHPAAVRTAIAAARERAAHLLTLWPRNAAVGPWEHLLIPLCAGIIALWFGRPTVSRNRGGPAFANGQFLLIERAAYEEIGGHAAVRRHLIEDVPLAELARRRGLRTHAAGGRDLVAVRMYDGYRATRDGWARIYAGALRSGVKLGLSIAWLLVGSLLPFVALPLLLASAAGAVEATPPLLLALCVQHLLLIGVVSYRFWGMGHCQRRYLWLYPVSVVLVTGILLRAWWWLVVRRSVVWRGTRYAIDGRGRLAAA